MWIEFFFRAIAPIFIFVDPISGNGLAALTLYSFGYADAAALFVFIAA